MLLKELSALASPLNDQQIGQLQQAVTDLSPQQMAWISGYFWGLSQTPATQGQAQSVALAVAEAVKPAGKLTIIYASQTGNAKRVAEQLASQAKAQDIDAALYSADDYKPKNLAKETHVVIVASTNGEGEPPDNAIALHEFLQSKKAPKLDKLRYAVLGLGDSSYEFFCQTGKDFDAYLAKLGATPILDRIDCDVDYDDAVSTWTNTVLDNLKDALSVTDEVVVPLHATAPVSTVYNKQNPYPAELITNQKITGCDSDKDVRHVEIDLGESGLTYSPGDALGVYFSNSPELVIAILNTVGLTGDESVQVGDDTLSLAKALEDKFEITASNPQQVKTYAELSGSKRLQKIVQDNDKLRQYANQTQLIDVLKEKKTQLTVEQLTGLLRKITPRLYSIASSQAEVGEEVHLTVGVVEFQRGDETRFGGASGFLAHRVEDAGQVRVFVEHNSHFALPDDDHAPIIMIGPGTGIAPFRAFMQEREARDAEGKNWLFFGARTFTQDFLYQVEWQKYLKDGVLNHLDLAFSRDQAKKVYVQDKLLEQGAEVWRWLEQGAYVYVCGDATHMAKDVHSALLGVIEQYGGKDKASAEAYLTGLRKEKRYQKDVY